MNDPDAWAKLLNAISNFITVHGPLIAGMVFFVILVVAGCAFVVWFVIKTKNEEIERLVQERNKWQGHFIKRMKSSKGG